MRIESRGPVFEDGEIHERRCTNENAENDKVPPPWYYREALGISFAICGRTASKFGRAVVSSPKSRVVSTLYRY